MLLTAAESNCNHFKTNHLESNPPSRKLMIPNTCKPFSDIHGKKRIVKISAKQLRSQDADQRGKQSKDKAWPPRVEALKAMAWLPWPRQGCAGVPGSGQPSSALCKSCTDAFNQRHFPVPDSNTEGMLQDLRASSHHMSWDGTPETSPPHTHDGVGSDLESEPRQL